MIRRAALICVLVAALASVGGRARGGAELTGVEVPDVREGEHALTVRIDGLLAQVEARQVVVNEGQRDTEVIYAFDLPSDAAVIGAEILLPDGRRAVSAAVDARAAFRFVPEDGVDAGAPDVGLLRLLDVDDGAGVARHELRVYPVPAGRSATAIVRWVAPLRYRDGRLTLRVPDRGGPCGGLAGTLPCSSPGAPGGGPCGGPAGAPPCSSLGGSGAGAANLVREQVELVWKAPAGARGLRDIRSGASRLAAATGPLSDRLRLSAPVGSDLVLEATPLFPPGRGLVAELAVAPLDGRRGAVALSVLAPELAPASATTFERVILVVDRSRSLGPDGLAAARAIADAMLDAANPAASVEAVLFDRRARPIMGGLSRDRAALRAALARALAQEPKESGSDLGAALAQVADLLRRAGPAAQSPAGVIARGFTSSTLVVVLTDGMLPLHLDGEQARGKLGGPTLAEVRVASIVLVPDGAAAPDLEHGPLVELARATGGRVVAVRHGDARERSPRLWSEIGQPPPYEQLHIDWRTSVITSDGAAPARLESGEGFLLVGWYHGARPGPIAIQAELRGRPSSLTVRPTGGALARAVPALTLVQRPPVELLPPATVGGERADERAWAELVRAAHRSGVATRATALVLLDRADAFARDRLAHASKWGTGQYRRFPPPAERRLGEVRAAGPEQTGKRPARPHRAGPRRTGELDKVLVGRLLTEHVVPRARTCYQRALRRDPRLGGTVVIELEMARGEVQHARVTRGTAVSSLLRDCLLDVAYGTPVPRLALGDTGEAIVVARYPLLFAGAGGRIEVSPTADRPSTGTPDPDDPLGGLGD